ncbi:MAG: TraB/GumN family protein [Pseudomonadota bacterium]
MRRQIIVVFFSLFWLVLGPAFGADRGALFKVTGDGHTMYLFGTIHVGQPEFYPLEPRIAAAVAGASTLALEIDPSGEPAAIAEALQAHGMAAPGTGLEEMTPTLRARLDKVLAKVNVDPAAVARFKPWLVATVLAMSEYAAQGYRADLSVDAHLVQLARASKVPVIALETPASQMKLFDRLSDTEQLRFLEDSVDMIESGKQVVEVRQIVDAWRMADKAALEAIAERADNDTTISGKFLKTVLLDERNVDIAAKLAALLKRSDGSVAAIGVLHLIGNKSVPALMKARGLTVERVY